jgi:hypothetical protein
MFNLVLFDQILITVQDRRMIGAILNIYNNPTRRFLIQLSGSVACQLAETQLQVVLNRFLRVRTALLCQLGEVNHVDQYVLCSLLVLH